ncbi:Pentatricopeptide repeat-containing protein [Trichinella pseudospiralis]|uniref:Protein sleepless n=1 Tax=Trichinella pseudospiralis TaxID=6337 RepID=A0A0V1FM77_TRIPS|nr:hypothetical protein T4D_13953 [Trichinella pseudospiralis]
METACRPLFNLALVMFVCIPAVLTIRCQICKRTEASLVPGSIANSVFVFDATGDDCDTEPVHCLPEERFCLGAWAELAPGRHWVQKGCISASADGHGLGCTAEPLQLRQNGNHFLHQLTADVRNVTMIVCVCNSGDFCNAGSVQAAHRRLTAFTASGTVSQNSRCYYSILRLYYFIFLLPFVLMIDNH